MRAPFIPGTVVTGLDDAGHAVAGTVVTDYGFAVAVQSPDGVIRVIDGPAVRIPA
jgi:hypothetical protein